MKKFIVLIITILIFKGIAFCQASFNQFSSEVPNYIKAENSNFVINFITSWKYKAVYKRDEFDEHKRMKFSGNVFVDQEIDLKLFDTLTVLITEQFLKLGMRPFAVINTNSADLTNPVFIQNQLNEFIKNKTGFVIHIACANWDKEIKDLKKGVFIIDNVKPITFSITIPGNTDPKNTFTMYDNGLTIGAALEKFKKKIEEKPESYFLKTMQIP
jgi:hypothetical protein